MSLSIHTSITQIPAGFPFTYFDEKYFQSQAYTEFIGYSNEDFFIPFDIIQRKAISIPRSPFGSFFCRNSQASIDEKDYEAMLIDLNRRGVKGIEIHHPSAIYSAFIDPHYFENQGFKTVYKDINQHIRLTPEWEHSIHNMQKRKLASLRNEGFEFRKMDDSEFEKAYKFLSVCRKTQGVQMNISWEQLKHLKDQLPLSYECFGVFREKTISALCVSVNVTQEVAYYYLPATSPMFRDKSPMVLLIAGMVDYYRNKGFKYFDLGVSSIQGKSQETLKVFKERMGAIATDKTTFAKTL